ncbi:MAG: hypothetical protein AAGM22_23560, partial [Acidobacteriota bacterium]
MVGASPRSPEDRTVGATASAGVIGGVTAGGICGVTAGATPGVGRTAGGGGAGETEVLATGGGDMWWPGDDCRGIGAGATAGSAAADGPGAG